MAAEILEFPKMRYHADGRRVVVHNPVEQAEVDAEGFSGVPPVEPEPVAPVQAPTDIRQLQQELVVTQAQLDGVRAQLADAERRVTQAERRAAHADALLAEYLAREQERIAAVDTPDAVPESVVVEKKKGKK
jgi:capsule polysaccharide export protein KpsE/RkpR